MKTVSVLRGRETLAPYWYGLNEHVKFIGGYVRWMVSPHHDPAPASDIDMWPLTDENMAKAEEWILRNVPLEPKSNKTLSHDTELSKSFKVRDSHIKLQLIRPLDQGQIKATGTLEDVLDNFDFTICRAGLVSLEQAIVDDTFIEDEMRKRLIIRRIHCPIGAVKRIAKYSKKGYNISPAELYKLYVDWDLRPVDYKDDLRKALEEWEEMKEDMAGMSLDERANARSPELMRLLYID